MPDRHARWPATAACSSARRAHRRIALGILTGRGFAALTVVGLAAAMAACAAPAAAPASSPRTHVGLVVGTADGQVRGKQASSTDDYLGIPYAAAPVGPLRWRPPQPPAPWHGIRPATHFAPHCPQPTGVFGRPSTSENCLYLNVFRPARQGSSDLPVMVWIHGGG